MFNLSEYNWLIDFWGFTCLARCFKWWIWVLKVRQAHFVWINGSETSRLFGYTNIKPLVELAWNGCQNFKNTEIPHCVPSLLIQWSSSPFFFLFTASCCALKKNQNKGLSLKQFQNNSCITALWFCNISYTALREVCLQVVSDCALQWHAVVSKVALQAYHAVTCTQTGSTLIFPTRTND